MKQKLSITIDRNTVASMESVIKEGRFRNKSHILEYAVDKLLRGTK